MISRSKDRLAVTEITLKGKGPRACAAAKAFFLAAGISSGEWAEAFHQGRFSLNYYATRRKKARSLRNRFLADRPSGIRFCIRHLGRSDWFDKWMQDYHVTPVGKRFVIVPVWERHKVPVSKRISILLDPKSAFGSGLHETTQLALKLLERLKVKDRRVLDIGTGTGVLAVAAAKLGAISVDGIDSDKGSAVEARENFILNQCRNGHFRRADLRKLAPSKSYDGVLANLFSSLLIRERKKIAALTGAGGFLIVSGILKRTEREFRRVFPVPGFSCKMVLRGRRWFAACYQKKRRSR